MAGKGGAAKALGPKKRAPAKRAAKDAPAKRSAKKAARKAPVRRPAKPLTPAPAEASPHPLPAVEAAARADAGSGWQPVAVAVPETASPATAAPPTAGWVALPPMEQPVGAPEDPAKGTTRWLAWTIILWIDLGFLALNFLLALAAGAILVFAPESGAADDLRDQFEGGSTRLLVVETLLTFTLMGVIPFLYVVFTRREKWEGTKRYLRLHSPFTGVVLGVVLTAVLLVAVAVLSVVYIVLTEGRDGLELEESEGENPAVDAILRNLSWPVAVLIAFCAGVGEEILFRGVLLRKFGLWPQAILFGLAHAAGGYIPQILFAFGLAVLFGYLLKRGVSMWALMTAHVLYDMTLLSIGLVFR